MRRGAERAQAAAVPGRVRAAGGPGGRAAALHHHLLHGEGRGALSRENYELRVANCPFVRCFRRPERRERGLGGSEEAWVRVREREGGQGGREGGREWRAGCAAVE